MTSTELIAKIKAEIERLQKYNHCMADNAINSNMRNFYDGEEDCCKQLLFFLSTLEPEKPMNQSEDVFKICGTTEKEYLAKSMDKVHLEMEISTYLKDWEDDEEIGLHLSTDNGCIPIELEDVRDLARHFAQWGIKK